MTRIPMNDGDEYDVFTRWRKVLCWTKRAGATAKVKRGYRRRLRRVLRATRCKEADND
jgi:hypothetical protein